ncbi:MAG: DUF359 domain-containing protein [Candidatus Bilamarchaeaceae archaeon]
MALIGRDLRERLKKPLGRVLSFEEAIARAGKRRIIAVGDEIVYNLLRAGKKPFVAVFDFKTLRKPVAEKVGRRIRKEYPKHRRISKPAGEISAEMFEVAKEMLKKGGALFVEGEEDLFALPFALLSKGEVVLYGQPGQGCVLVRKGSFKKREYWKMVGKMGLALSHAAEA